MVVHYREERSRVEFKERLAEYALVSAATPIELALYANDLARGLGLDANDLAEIAAQERADDRQLELDPLPF